MSVRDDGKQMVRRHHDRNTTDRYWSDWSPLLSKQLVAHITAHSPYQADDGYGGHVSYGDRTRVNTMNCCDRLRRAMDSFCTDHVTRVSVISNQDISIGQDISLEHQLVNNIVKVHTTVYFIRMYVFMYINKPIHIVILVHHHWPTLVT